jgi:hypothetical protein
MHGLHGSFAERAWSSSSRTPPLYPDAVTLTDDATPADVLECIDRSPGCSVKDSFSALDLAPHGFRVLFDADWIERDTLVRAGDDAIVWTSTVEHRTAPEIVSLTGRLDDVLVASAAATFAGGVAGLTDVTALATGLDRAWRSLTAAVQQRFPGVAVVGYESGESLTAALGVGFRSIGLLRVWVRDG